MKHALKVKGEERDRYLTIYTSNQVSFALKVTIPVKYS